MMPRFTGATGRRNLLTATCFQRAVAGNQHLARRLVAAGILLEFPAGKIMVRQGDTDNDIYLILSGSVSISVNRREIAVRTSGTHVGEMALLDPTARRSATIAAKERTAVLKLSEVDVTRIAHDFPDFWRQLAIELASRLRERSKFIREPNSVPSVFIGSSSEALTEAGHINRMLERRDFACKLWTQGVFQLSQVTIEDLIRASQECDFAVLFLTPDDTTSSRGSKTAAPRDNVVFELGLFMGAIGRERTFLVVRKGAQLKLPTDLLGVTHAPYVQGNARSLGKRLRNVARIITHRIESIGAK
jgi:CRP/FNR family cyclic AMP-dependent transcriptional regulator